MGSRGRECDPSHPDHGVAASGAVALQALGGGLARSSRASLLGGGFVLARIGNYAAGDGDNMVVAKWLGLSALGLYDRAYQLMVAPAMLLGQVMDEILFASLARIQDDRSLVAAAYRR